MSQPAHLQAYVESVRQRMAERRRYIEAAYAEGRTPEQVAAELGITRDRVVRIAPRPCQDRADATERREYVRDRFAEGATAEEVAAELGINTRSVYRLVPRGRITRSHRSLAGQYLEARRLFEEEGYPYADACALAGVSAKGLRRTYPDLRVSRERQAEMHSLHAQARRLYERIDAGKITYRIA